MRFGMIFNKEDRRAAHPVRPSDLIEIVEFQRMYSALVGMATVFPARDISLIVNHVPIVVDFIQAFWVAGDDQPRIAFDLDL